MSKTSSNPPSYPEKTMTKRAFQEMAEVESFYKLIHKYNLREEAYKVVLKSYIQIKEAKEKS